MASGCHLTALFFSLRGLDQKYAATHVSETMASWPPRSVTPTSVKPKMADDESRMAPMVAAIVRHEDATCEPSSVTPWTAGAVAEGVGN